MKIVSKIVEILLKIEEKRIMQEVSKDERVKDAKVPDEVRDAIFDEASMTKGLEKTHECIRIG